MDSVTAESDNAGHKDGPVWTRKQYSFLHNLITSVEQSLQKRYDALEKRLMVLEEKVTAATSCASAAKQVADDIAALVTTFRVEINSTKHVVQESMFRIKLCVQTMLRENCERAYLGQA